MTGKSKGGQVYEAFGESKTISQWAHDPRCKVSRGTLKTRIQRYGVLPEIAITSSI